MGKLYITVSLVFFISCENISRMNDSDAKAMNEVKLSAIELAKEIKSNGSISAYQSFEIAYIDDSKFGNFYEMSKIMADQYNYLPAYYRVYTSIIERGTSISSSDIYNLEVLSETDKEEALIYLRLGAEKGETQCQNRVKSYISEKKYFTASDTLMW